MKRILLLLIVVITYFCQGILCQLVCRDGQLRRDSDNRLWACFAGQWGTVCGNYFDKDDAVVACRNLGYGDTESDISYSTMEGATGFIALGSLQCDGSEYYLLECLNEFGYLDNCDHTMDITITCPTLSCVDDDIRLVDGFSSEEGTLEVCENGGWNAVCGDGFGSQDAYVACRQLGLGASTAEVTDTSSSPGHGWAKYTKLSCIGTEESLLDCTYTVSDGSCLSHKVNTGHVNIAQIKCSGDSAPGACPSSTIRINNNGEIQKKGSGRLELCENGAWGTVNNNMFSVKDSLVACRQLGVPNPSTQVYPQGYYNNSVAGPVIMKDLMCAGSEISLYTIGPVACNPDKNTADLDHSTDVFLNCWTKVVAETCNDGDVRLSDGTSKDEGRVEVCKGEEWGTFCDNFWDRREAQVICRQLGYPNPYGAFYLDSEFGTGDQIPYFFTDVNCTGSENGIMSCERSDQIEGDKCLYGQAVGVKCYNNTGCTDGEVRLIGGNNFEGDVQICKDGVWGYICDEKWAENAARVVCREQGFSDQWYGRSTSSLFGGGQDIAPIIYDAITCGGSEDNLANCAKQEYSTLNPTCRYVAGVTCLKNDECKALTARLQDGSVSSEGRLEVCISGSWTTFKSNQITYDDAKVICTQLGYDSEWSVATEGNTWGTGDRMIYYDQVNCDGTESSLSDCDKTPITNGDDAINWYGDQRAGISCENRDLAESCAEEGATRLKDGITSRDGRLEICFDGYWGSVCNRGWTQNNGLVACRQVGYETLRPLLTSSPTRMNGSVSVHNAQCNGHESQLEDCEYSEAIGVSSCHHGEDVALICSELPEPYSVITISSNVEEPIPFGSEVTLTCEGAPETGDVFYSWSRDNIDWEVNTSSVTFKVGVYFTKTFNAYCNVYRTNEKVAVGMRTFTVEDLLTAVEDTIVATLGSDITLSFNRQTTHVNDYLRDLTWTLEGNPLDTSQSRLTVSDDGLSLTISDVIASDYGIYNLQYNGLYVVAYNEFCEDTTLSFLREYPILSPGYIIVTLPGVSTDTFDSENYNHQLLQTYDVINYTLAEPLVVVTALRSASIPTESNLLPEWYFNGAQYLGLSEITLRDNFPIHNIALNYPVLFDSGYYELVLKYPFESIFENSGCSSKHGSSYLEFLWSAEFLGFEEGYLVLDTATIEVRYNEMPTAQLTSDRSSFSIVEDAFISCVGRLGYPRYYDVSIWKNGMLLKNATGPLVEFSTADITYGSKYGVYSCSVNNMLLEDSTSLKISNEAMISLLFGNVNCDDFGYNVADIEPSALNRFEDTCNCTLNNAMLKDSTLSCPVGRNMATFNTTLVYTNDDGSLTANDIVNSTLTEFSNRINRTLTFDGDLKSLSIMIGPADPKDSFELSEVATIGIAFAGGFLVGSLILIIIVLVLVVMILRHKKTNRTKQATNEQVKFHNEEVEINQDDIDDNDFQALPEDDPYH